MNVSDSECSSGCESGWTLYLEQSFPSPNASHKRSGFLGKNTGFCDIGAHKEKGLMEEEEEEDDEEDLSMVSDASSGPPHFHEEEEEETLLHFNNKDKPCFCSTTTKNNIITTSKTSGTTSKRQKMKEQLFSCGDQDDTASSPLFNFSNMEDFTMTNNQGSVESGLDYSQGFSATHFQSLQRRRPAFQDPLGYLQSSLSGNQHQQMSDLKDIRRWK